MRKGLNRTLWTSSPCQTKAICPIWPRPAPKAVETLLECPNEPLDYKSDLSDIVHLSEVSTRGPIPGINPMEGIQSLLNVPLYGFLGVPDGLRMTISRIVRND